MKNQIPQYEQSYSKWQRTRVLEWWLQLVHMRLPNVLLNFYNYLAHGLMWRSHCHQLLAIRYKTSIFCLNYVQRNVFLHKHFLHLQRQFLLTIYKCIIYVQFGQFCIRNWRPHETISIALFCVDGKAVRQLPLKFVCLRSAHYLCSETGQGIPGPSRN